MRLEVCIGKTRVRTRKERSSRQKQDGAPLGIPRIRGEARERASPAQWHLILSTHALLPDK